MTVIPTDVKAPPDEPGKARVLLGYLVHDKLALLSAIYLLLLVAAAIFGPLLVGDMATKLGLRQRNLPPFSLDQGWAYGSAPIRSAAASSPVSSWGRRTRWASPRRRCSHRR